MYNKENDYNNFNEQTNLNGYETLNKPKNEDDCPNNEINGQIINKSIKEKEIKIVLNESDKTRESNQEKEKENPNNLNQIKENNLLIVEENNQEQTPINNKGNKKSKLGRKKKGSNEVRKHTKYSSDNIFKKIKSCVLEILYPLINKKIVIVYNGNIGQGIFKKILLKIKQDQILNSKDDDIFMKKEIKDILSEDISNRFSNHLKQHNKNLIEQLLNEEDEEKRNIFKEIFGLTFIDCLEHFRGTKYFSQLQGLETLNKYCKKFENDEDYLKLFKHYVYNFEKEVLRKRKK
jgi:hypothetical protein